MKSRRELRMGMAELIPLRYLKNQVVRFAYKHHDYLIWRFANKYNIGCALCKFTKGCNECIYYLKITGIVDYCSIYKNKFKSKLHYCEARELDYLMAYTARLEMNGYFNK